MMTNKKNNKTPPPELTDVCLAPVQPSISALLRVSRRLQPPPLLAQTRPTSLTVLCVCIFWCLFRCTDRHTRPPREGLKKEKKTKKEMTATQTESLRFCSGMQV